MNNLLETEMLGMPIFTTAVSGVKEMIDLAEAGLVVSNSTTAFYNGLMWVLDNPEVIREWKKILKTTKNSFSYQERKKKLFEVLGV